LNYKFFKKEYQKQYQHKVALMIRWISGTIFKPYIKNKQYERMDVVIFFKAIGSLLFAGILLLTVLMTTCLSIISYAARQIKAKAANANRLMLKSGKQSILHKILAVKRLTSDAAEIQADYSHQ
jgi:hypothetical protein